MTWTIIIAGGRDADEAAAVAVLDRVLKPEDVAIVVSGGACGWDTAGERWAEKHGKPVKRFPADWNRLGKAAGFLRNEQMARFARDWPPGRLYVGPGGRGTADMVRRARRHGLSVEFL